jgi:hypothetical protein
MGRFSSDRCKVASTVHPHVQYNSSFGSRSLSAAALPSSLPPAMLPSPLLPPPALALVYTRRRWLRSDLRFPTASSTCSGQQFGFGYAERQTAAGSQTGGSSRNWRYVALWYTGRIARHGGELTTPHLIIWFHAGARHALYDLVAPVTAWHRLWRSAISMCMPAEVQSFRYCTGTHEI